MWVAYTIVCVTTEENVFLSQLTFPARKAELCQQQIMGHESLAIYCWSYNVLHMLAFHLLLLIRPVMSNSLWPHRLKHTRPTCSSSSPWDCPSSCSLHQWCHPAISSSDALFSFCPWSFPASETFPVSCLFTSDDQNTGASAQHQSFQWIFRVNLPWDWLIWYPGSPRDFPFRNGHIRTLQLTLIQ